ncbi:unnamed protein product, partial [Cyprideis torosa]
MPQIITEGPVELPEESLDLVRRFFPEGSDEEAISGGNFHGQNLAMVLDYVTLATAELGNISDRRSYLLLDGKFGLPKMLSPVPGLNSGYMIAQYTTAALVTENKTLCFPASADSIPTSMGQEDHVSMGSISGDIDIRATKELVKKWFGEIEKGPEVEQMKPMPVVLKETKKLQHEDDFAKLPQIHMVFPGVENYHPDEYALEFLGNLLAGSKQTPFYQVIVEEKKLAPNAWAYHSGNELAGEFILEVRANEGVDLDDVKKAIEEALKLFESKGISDEDMKQIRAQLETRTYRGVETLLDK